MSVQVRPEIRDKTKLKNCHRKKGNRESDVLVFNVKDQEQLKLKRTEMLAWKEANAHPSVKEHPPY
jgi:hypothetical protein